MASLNERSTPVIVMCVAYQFVGAREPVVASSVRIGAGVSCSTIKETDTAYCTLERQICPITPASNQPSFRYSRLSTPSILHAVSYTSPHFPLELFLVLSPELAGIDVGRAFVVGTSEHTDDRKKDCLGRKNR